jgi:SAM-dependent methyltransferase
MNLWKVLPILLQENLRRRDRVRIPEPALMSDTDQVRAFDSMGDSGDLIAIYHFNVMLLNPLLDRGATVLDLGCGTARFLAYLARVRPDLHLIGLDLSKEMVRQGEIQIKQSELQSKIRLVHGNMLEFRKIVPEKVDFIVSMFALHHLPSTDHLCRFVAELALARKEQDCGLWFFDHSRPRWEKTPDHFVEAFTPQAPLIFKEDSKNSLRAAFTESEITHINKTEGLELVRGWTAKILPLYQIHRLLLPTRTVPTSIPTLGAIDKSLSDKVNSLFRLFPHLKKELNSISYIP